MKLTQQLKSWLRENQEVPEDADDGAYTKALAEAMCSDKITSEQVTNMTKDPDAEKGSQLTATLASMQQAMTEMAKQITELSKQRVEPQEQKARPVSNVTTSMIDGGQPATDDVRVDVKSVEKMYSTSRSAKFFPQSDRRGLKHPFAGQRMFEDGMSGRRQIDESSELDRAVNGAVAKMMLFDKPIKQGLVPSYFITDHDRALYQYALRNMEWAGTFFNADNPDGRAINNRRLRDDEIKATGFIVDDDSQTTTGGLEAVPIVFDDDVITKPLHHSDFYPRCNVKTITRGRRVEGVVLGNILRPADGTVGLTWSASGSEYTAISLATTDAFVAAFDTKIFPVTQAILIGLDFLSDTPVAFGDHVTTEFGEALAYDLDRVIVSGDGTTQPTGIHDQGTNVPFGDAWEIDDIVKMMFTVDRAHQKNTDINRVCWGAQESSYADIRGIATGVTNDDRLIFGMNDLQDYTLLGHPFLTNAAYGAKEMNYVNLAHYRIYRRLGLTISMTTEGYTLGVANNMAVICRARFGGQLERTNYCAYTADGA